MACGWWALQFITSPKYVPAQVTNKLPIHFDKSKMLLKIPLQHTCVRSSSKKDIVKRVYMLKENVILMGLQFDHYEPFHLLSLLLFCGACPDPFQILELWFLGGFW